MRASISKLPFLPQASSHCSRIALALLVVSCCFAFGCSTGSKPKVEPAPAPIAKVEEPAPQVAKLPSPELHQVQEAVKRVFKEAAVIDSSQRPAFVAGDFNGDLSEDIANIQPGSLEIRSEHQKLEARGSVWLRPMSCWL